MSVRWPVVLAVCLPLGAAPTLVSAQTATRHGLTTPSLPPAPNRFQHHKVLRAAYDSVADSTHISVVTHKGKYFLTVQRPRLTWSVIYGGRTATTVPTEVSLEFRTQAPQVAADSRLQIEYGTGQRLEVASARANSVAGTLTWSHFMHFPVPTAGLAGVLTSDSVVVSVGGIVERLKQDQLEALRELLERVRAWPEVPAPTP